MNKTGKRFPGLTSGVLSRLTAAAVTLPFLLALPGYIDADRTWWNIGLAASIVALYVLAQIVSQYVARGDGNRGLVAAFAVLYLVLGLLGFASTQDYRFDHALTDLGLLFYIFLAAAGAAWIAAPLGRAVLTVLVLSLGIAAVLQAVHMQTFGFAIGAAGYRAILQSSIPEAREFAGHFLGAASIGAALVALALVVAAALAVPSARASGKALALGGLCAAAAFPILGENAGQVASRFQVYAEAVEYAEEIMEYRALREARGSRSPDVRQEGPLAGVPQTYVFVVGESLTRNHMSLYGYWRETTPSLARLADEMAVFTDVVSPHSHTDQSLELVLTLASQTNGVRFTDDSNYSLIEMLRAAGFATWWISNQNTFGPWDNKTSVLASGADRVHFTSTRSGAFVTGPLDEALLEPFSAALQDPAPRKAIFLHFLGNHWEYAKRYPPRAANFHQLPSPGEIGAWRPRHPRLRLANEYDNSVRYHDYLAGQIVEKVRSTGQAAVVALFSDHGESIYEFKGHYWKQFTRDHVEVPLLLWFSPEYARLAPQTVEQARAAVRRPFALEDFPHLVADIASLRSAPLQRARSPLNSAYDAPGARQLFEGALVYEEADEALLSVRRALRRIAQTHPELHGALWAHRVNTLGKMMEVATLFAGAEIDVAYDVQAGALVVHHPTAPPSGLRLDALLGYANRLNPKLALWLDVKNLDAGNAARIVEALDRLDARHAIRSRAIVETPHAGPEAALLRQAGFVSSYYLPTAVITERGGAGSLSGGSCQGATEIQRILRSGRFAAVSYDWRGRQWVERCLGRFVREQGLRSYAWDLTPVLSEPRSHEALDEERLRGYSAVAAVLLPYRSTFDDWR